MMLRNVTTAVLLKRLDFQDADRIITCLSPDFGKITLLARAVRKSKSKLAGGIELFSVNQITFISGKKDIGTLVSARMQANFGQIVKDVDRTMWAYEMLRIFDKHTEQNVEAGYFDILVATLKYLDNFDLDLAIIKAWFFVRFLELSGHSLNLKSDLKAKPLKQSKTYQYSFEDRAFFDLAGGPYNANHIKFLRLCVSHSAIIVNKITKAQNLAVQVNPMLSQQFQLLQ